ncbi:hypothetical protein [Stenotrophomonas sp. PS02289]|uniref:hypothetical protein n=1 Tax=Stenotrophomonas sp. PS02289 TaxID=2991422 RepID=UPI00249CB819|nr:hypothetical protein [Stenotrophomonas sp. PS02289]
MYWILESLFDDTLDDYPDAYTVYPVDLEENSLLSVLQRHHDDPPASALGTLPVSRLIFDPTTRASFEIA